jgi:hypothetical protein
LKSLCRFHVHKLSLTGGDQLVFRYPTVIRDKVSKETMSAFASSLHEQGSLGDADQQEPKFMQRMSWNAGDVEENRQSEELKQYPSYNLPSVVLGPLLIPKVSTDCYS